MNREEFSGLPLRRTTATLFASILLAISAAAQSLVPAPRFLRAGGVRTALVQPDGKIIVVGSFSEVNGKPRGNVARLNSDGSLDSAFVAGVTDSGYTAIVRGSNGTTGIGLVEVYDLDGNVSGSKLANIATRGKVLTGDNAMIGGFILGGATGAAPDTLIVRGIGPSVPVSGALADPFIEVHDSHGNFLASNDNWKDATTMQEITDSGIAPTNELESALWGILNPGAYTVIVRGNGNTTGIALVEVYDLRK